MYVFAENYDETNVLKFYFKDNNCEGTQENRIYFDFDYGKKQLIQVDSRRKQYKPKHTPQYYEKLLSKNTTMMVKYDTRNFKSFLRKDWRRMTVLRLGNSAETELGRNTKNPQYISKKGVWAACANDQPSNSIKFYVFERFLDIKYCEYNWSKTACKFESVAL